MPRQLVECVPNFSEGRDTATMDAIARAVLSVPEVALLDRESDTDHNRCVLTFAGPPEARGRSRPRRHSPPGSVEFGMIRRRLMRYVWISAIRAVREFCCPEAAELDQDLH